MGYLDGKAALITGGGTGIGRATALLFAGEGADVAVNYSRSRTEAEATAADIRALGRRSLAVCADVSNDGAVRHMVDGVVSELGRLDILINNAGIIERAPAVEHPDEAWDAVLRVNLDAVWFGSREAGRLMIDGGGGKIITTASILSFSGGILVPGYAASKGAIAQLTKALANEWAFHGVNVNAIAPGYFVTRNTDALRADQDRSRAILERVPAGRWGDPSDLKGAAVYLASSAADYVHGHVLVVDGGWCAR